MNLEIEVGKTYTGKVGFPRTITMVSEIGHRNGLLVTYQVQAMPQRVKLTRSCSEKTFLHWVNCQGVKFDYAPDTSCPCDMYSKPCKHPCVDSKYYEP